MTKDTLHSMHGIFEAYQTRLLIRVYARMCTLMTMIETQDQIYNKYVRIYLYEEGDDIEIGSDITANGGRHGNTTTTAVVASVNPIQFATSSNNDDIDRTQNVRKTKWKEKQNNVFSIKKKEEIRKDTKQLGRKEERNILP